jgi:hypothetical protein
VLRRTVSLAHSLWAAAEGTTVAPIVTAGRSTITMSRLRLIVAAALTLTLVLPATALAATTDVGGTVTLDGNPAAGAEVTVLVQGSDQILATTTDENGAWALQVDVEPGAILEVNGTGGTTTSKPDKDGCITSTTPSGQVQVTIPAEGAVPAIDFPLDTLLTGTVCATKTPPDTGGNGGGNGSGPKPAQQKPNRGGVTPPSTDTITVGGPMTSGNAALLVIGALVAMTGLVLAVTSRRRSPGYATARSRTRR